MPNIETFTDNVRAPAADQTGSEAYEIEGRHIESAYSRAGSAIGGGIAAVGKEVEQHEEIQDTSNNSVQAAAIFSNLSAKLSQTATAAAADPTNAAKHFQDFQAAMDSSIGSIGVDAATPAGQEHAATLQATLRQEFTRQTIGAQSMVDGQVVQSNLLTMKNNIAQAVSNNPTLLPTGIALLNGTMEDQLKAHNLSPEENTRIRQEFTAPAVKDLGIAAFQTMAQKNPDAAKAALQTGQFANMFSGEEIGSLNRYADAQSKALTEAQKNAITVQKQQDTEEFRQTTSAMVGSMIQPDGSLKIPAGLPQQIIKASLMPGAEPGEIRSLADMTKTIIKDQSAGVKAVTDPETFSAFGTRMLNGSLSAQDVYNARNNGQLSDKDTSYFLSGMKNLEADPARKDAEKQFNNWVLAQKPAFQHASIWGGVDPVGAQKFNQFQQAAHAQFEQTYNTKGDWQGMLNARNPNYLGKIAPSYMSNVKGASLPPPVHVTSVDDAMKLKPGTQFIDPTGTLRTR